MKLFHASLHAQTSARGAVPLKSRRENHFPHYGYQNYATECISKYIGGRNTGFCEGLLSTPAKAQFEKCQIGFPRL